MNTEQNQQAVDNPKPGDYWQERFCPYFLVVDVKGDSYTVLSCLGGPNSFTRKHELNAKIDGQDGWHFDYSKSMVVDKDWILKAVTYGTITGFAADVVNSEKTRLIVTEWRSHVQQEMKRKIDSLQQEWEQFTGWKYLKEDIS